MGVTISSGSAPLKLPAVRTATEPTPRHMPKTLHRDTRADPMPEECKVLMTLQKPDKAQMMAAWNAMLPMMNLIPYWTDDWAPVFKRHSAMHNAILAGKVKDAKGLMKQIVDAYRKVMKTGTWKGDEYGKAEPK